MAWNFNIDDIVNECGQLIDYKLNYAEMIYQDMSVTSDFIAEHNIQTGIEHGSAVAIMERSKNYGFLKASSTVGCEWNTCDIVDTVTGKTWEPAKYDCQLEICVSSETFTQQFKQFWNLNCSDFGDSLPQVLAAYFVDRSSSAMNDAQWRIAYADYKNNPSTDYAGIDNFFIQWGAIATVGHEQRITIPENANTTIEEQLQLAPDRAYNVFKEMYSTMLTKRQWMTTKQNLQIEVTPELAMNYLLYLQDNKEVNCCFSSTDGITTSRYSLDNLNYMGVPVKIRYEWGDLIKSEFISGISPIEYVNPHRAVLTYLGNKPVGTCDENKLRNVKTFFNEENMIFKVRIESSFDVKVPLDKDFILAM